MTTINPDMLVLAREAAGVTQAGLAERLGVSQARISKIEHGAAAMEPPLAKSASRVLSIHYEALYRASPVAGWPINFHKKLQSTGQRRLRSIHAQLNLRRFEILELLSRVPVDCPYEVPSLDLHEYGNDMDAVAGAVREQLGVPHGPVRDLVGLLEDSGVVVMPFAFGTASIRAITMRGSGTEPHFIFYNQSLPADKQRAWLCHELGHLVLHRLPHQQMEKEADSFIGAFLLPKNAILNRFPPRIMMRALFQMKTYWGVEAATLLKRAHTLGRLSDRQAKYMWIEYSKAGFRSKPEPQTFDAEQPTLVKELLAAYQNDLGYTAQELRDAMKVDAVTAASYYEIDDHPIRTSGLRLVRGG